MRVIAMTAREREGRATRLAVFAAAVAAALLVIAWPGEAGGFEGIEELTDPVVSGGSAESYPRLANIYFPTLIGADLEKLARWDVLVLAKRAQAWYQDELEELRRLNPDIVLLVHMPVGYHGDYSEPPLNGDMRDELYGHDWWMRDARGEIVRLGFGSGPEGDGLLNVTAQCPTDPDGRRLCDWLPEYIATRLGPGGYWDGVYLDCCWDRVSWLNGSLEAPIDANRDGVADAAEPLDESWREGMSIVVSRLRDLVGPDYAIVTNGNNTFYDDANGGTRESFPDMHGDWYENIANEEYGYATMDSMYRTPTLNVVNAIWYGPADELGPLPSSGYERKLGFTLASTLVFGDGYYSFDGGADLRGHSQTWWFDLYDLDLGRPTGPCERATATPGGGAGNEDSEYIMIRRFTKGIVAVNPTWSAQSIELPGAYYERSSWNGAFYPVSAARTEASVGYRSGEILVGSGMVPVETPRDVRVARRHGAIEVSWDAVPGAARYSIYRSSGVGDDRNEVLVGVVRSPCFVDGETPRGGLYAYRVAPIDASNCEGRRSCPTEATAELGSDLSFVLTALEQDGLLALTWEPLPGGRDFAIVRIDPDGGHTEIWRGSRGGAIVDEGAAPGVSYTYEALPADGDSPPLARAFATAPDRISRLDGCMPNPARGPTEIAFEVGGAGGETRPVTLTVYDVAGRVVARVLDDAVPPGAYVATWDGRTDRGEPAASGCYMVALGVGEHMLSDKVVLVR